MNDEESETDEFLGLWKVPKMIWRPDSYKQSASLFFKVKLKIEKAHSRRKKIGKYRANFSP